MIQNLHYALISIEGANKDLGVFTPYKSIIDFIKEWRGKNPMAEIRRARLFEEKNDPPLLIQMYTPFPTTQL